MRRLFVKTTPLATNQNTQDFYSNNNNEFFWGAISLTDKPDIAIKGNKSLTFINKSMKGNKPDFTKGYSRQESLLLKVNGKAYGNEINVDISDSSQSNPEERKASLELKNKLFEFVFGEYKVSMNDNKFALFSKTLNGFKLESVTGNTNFLYINSTSKGVNKKDSFYGNSSQGPFHLSSAPVIVGSELVRVNDQKQVRGKDYDIDYLSGKLSFLNKIIEPLEKVDVTYEYSLSLFKRTLNSVMLGYGQEEKIGAVFIRDADEAELADQTSINATEHIVLGVNAKKKINKDMALDIQGAWSRYNPNVLQRTGLIQGGAIYSKILYESNPFSVDMEATRVGESYRSIGNPDFNQGYRNYYGCVGYTPISRIKIMIYKNLLRQHLIATDMYKHSVSWALDKDCILEYNYNNKNENGQGSDKNNNEQSLNAGFSLFGIKTNFSGQYSEVEDNVTSINNFSKVTYGISNIFSNDGLTVSGRGSFSDYRTKSGISYNSQHYTLKANSKLLTNLAIDGEVDRKQQSNLEPITFAYLNYDAFIDKNYSSNGKYTLQYLVEETPLVKEDVSKHDGSFTFRANPVSICRIQYTISPKYTIYPKNKLCVEKRIHNQAKINLSVLKNLQIALNIKNDTGYEWDRKTVDTRIIKSTAKEDIYLYYATYQPLRNIDMIYRNSYSSATKALYDTISTSNNLLSQEQSNRILSSEFETKFRVTRELSCGLEYKNGQSTEINNNPTRNEIIDTISLKSSGRYDFSRDFNFTAALASVQEHNRFYGSRTYSYVPSIESYWMPCPGLSINFSYNLSRSYSGSEKHLEKTIINVDYVAGYVNCSLRSEFEYNANPYWETLLLQGKTSLVF
ncbi:MAG: hypothetical protein DKM50_13550 [Candidatus Margulisiibacteriota bacterium]|nr:MAG: hypothetical protein A2X43_10700 [Candidatus Margulisbacteria bacterium GWD2_39_127]PZM77273.1 MAG: hypothetical protein DKM50_13550 [Candidatus Margulisiibacteriota bacterium]HAR64398.1 hypothetical protein [Candidatus Margulisiibacteriota bacterium]HCT84821.1 hypothetical protein [Candidatus Margulisiibacteriota bacterium]